MESTASLWAGLDCLVVRRARVGRVGRLVLGLVVAVVVCGLGVLVSARGARAAGCANEGVRSAQFSTFLPDCRAYELVSPPDGVPYLKGVSEASGAPTELPSSLGVRASGVGGGVAWFSFYPLSGSPGGGFYTLSRRGAGGWVSEDVTPRLSTRDLPLFACNPLLFFSGDLSRSVLTDGIDSASVYGPGDGSCGVNDPALVEGEPEGFQDVFLRNSATGSYSLVNMTPPETVPANAYFQGASEDFSHVVFEDAAVLTAGAPAGASLYEWVGGSLHLVTVLPDGAASAGVLPGAVHEGNEQGTAPVTNPVSGDGSRVVFEAGGKLYLREGVERVGESAVGPGGECAESAKACTVQLDAAQPSGPGGGGVFLAANAPGTVVFFTDTADLTGSATGVGQHLYEYSTATGVLTDLTPAGELGLEGLSAISRDGSYLYVAATAALTGEATVGHANLYVFHAGVPRFIATLEANPTERLNWLPSVSTGLPPLLTARVSSSGRFFVFNSARRLTAADNTDAVTGEQDVEVYLFDAEAVSEALRCISCGVGRPLGSAAIQPVERSSESPAPVYVQRNLLDDGRVFFDSFNPLTAGAVNGRANVYEYAGGQVSLISSGTSEFGAFFLDASPGGEDVYFATVQHLVRGDGANGPRLYDARVNGGYPEPATVVPCGGEGCSGPAPGAPSSPALSSTGLHGSGNLPAPQVVPLTPRERLVRALVACRRVRKAHKRAACVRRARAHYRAELARHGGGK